MSQVAESTDLERGREAAFRNAWREAYELLSSADRAGLLVDGKDIEALAEACWWVGRADEGIPIRERANAAYAAAGDPLSAASSALALAREYGSKQEHAVSAGWMSRGERLLADLPESPVHGFLHFMHAMGAYEGGMLDAAREKAALALELAGKFAVLDLQGYGVMVQGLVEIADGNIKEGMALMDEATVAAVSGELSPMATGVIYCNMISACRDLADYRRAGEWTEAAKRWCERQSITGFPGVCRVHRAEIMALRGAWPEAEQEARRAAEELKGFNATSIAAISFYEMGEIRLRMGDLPAAEEALRTAHEMGKDPHPGLAMLWLAQGKPEAAFKGLKRAVGEAFSAPVKARLLPALIDVALVAGQMEEAKTGAGELRQIAEKLDTPALHAAAAAALGAVAIADGKAEEAMKSLRKALALWQEVDVPFEAARTRVLIAAACRVDGDEETALLELQSAKTAFQRLGAVLEIKKVNDLLGDEVGIAIGQGARVTKTFLFTDIVGSTNLVEVLGDEAWEDLIRWHDETLRTLIARHGGEEIRHQGDGFVLAFGDPAMALDCAIHIQRALADHRRSQGFAPQVRIGLHIAEATKRGLDYSGRGIHEAARVGALAEGGEILASRNVLDASKTAFGMGEPRTVALKGLSEPLEVVPVDWR